MIIHIFKKVGECDLVLSKNFKEQVNGTLVQPKINATLSIVMLNKI